MITRLQNDYPAGYSRLYKRNHRGLRMTFHRSTPKDQGMNGGYSRRRDRGGCT
jgi:hypothetical protein